MSEIFFANLGIKNYDIDMENARYRLMDFVNYLQIARQSQQQRNYSLNWKILDDNSIEEILRIKFIEELKLIEPYIEMPISSIEDFVKNDRDLLLEIQSKIEDEFENITNKKYFWIKVYEKKKTEQGYKIIQNFFRTREIYSKKNFDRENKINVLNKEINFNALKINKLPTKSDKVFLKYFPVSLNKQLDALYQLQKRPSKIHLPLMRLIMNKYFTIWDDFTLEDVDEWKYLFEDDREGIDRQREFVKIALNTPDFAILEGPPGSGKTHTICELICQILKNDQRVLLCASTNVAVDNVLEKIKDDETVIAVRIGKENVADTVKECIIDEIEYYESYKVKKRLLAKKKNKTITESQDYLLGCLQGKESKIIKDIFLEAANLVCGTTIGILQHPDFKWNSSVTSEVYDYLIIDEASKTTFQEFLVPALHAKKWIIVGDFKQLSPYVDPEDIAANIYGILDPKFQDICLEIFNSYYGSELFQKSVKFWKNILIFEEDKYLRDLYYQQAIYLNLDAILIESNTKQSIELLASQVIIGSSESIMMIEDDIPPDIHIVNTSEEFESFNRRREYWIENFQPKLELKNKNKGWSYEVAWRLVRLHETRLTENLHQFYERQIYGLFPHFIVDELYFDSENVKSLYEYAEKKKDLVYKIGFPSIIESLQKGIETNQNSRSDYILANGFDSEILEKRSILLEYQYRMHDEIAKFPRDHFYNKDALKKSDKTIRDWNYSRYHDRVYWVNTAGFKDIEFNRNENEAENILIELQHFVNWAEMDKEKKKWEVAILPFYASQEQLIRKKLQKMFNTKNRRYFKTRKKKVEIQLCIVDRFQGHEADIVFLSFVQTSKEGFLNSVNRLNVALTRARYQLVIFGKYKYFKNKAKSKIFNELAEHYDGKVIYPKRK